MVAAAAPPPVGARSTLILHTTCGPLAIELAPRQTPGLSTFKHLVRGGFYDGLTFPQVVKERFVRSGDPDGVLDNGTDGPGFTVGRAAAARQLTYGDLVLLTTADGRTATSQFLIVAYPSSDGLDMGRRLPLIGRVAPETFETLDAISSVAVDPEFVPLKPVRIDRAEIR